MTRTIIAGGRDLPEDMTFWPALSAGDLLGERGS